MRPAGGRLANLAMGGAARLAALVGAVAVTGCGAGLPDATAVPDPEAFPPPESVVPEGIAEDHPAPFRLVPGDVVTVSAISAETTAYEGLVVDEAGLLHVPLAGDIEVGGLTLEEAEARVQEGLRRFDTVVVATLTVTDPAGHRASVIGAVTTPGRIDLVPGTRVTDLLAAAGGPITDVEGSESVVYANLHGARLIRNGEALPISVAQALEGDLRHNVRVRPGDTLYVPPTTGSRITVLGEVEAPTVLPYRAGILLTEALAVASGLTIDGDRADIRVVRGDFRAPQVYTTSLRALVDGDSHNVMLAPGDIVYVTQHWFASVGEVLDRLAPVLASFTAFGIAYGLAQ